jgi:hypothetical protein
MTDSGLFSDIYQGIRDQADLLDRVLVRLKAGTSAAADEDRRRLAAWIAALTAAHTDDPAATTVRVLLRCHGAAVRQGWAAAGVSLRSDGVGPDVVDRLEGLARALDREQAAVLARFRGEV